MKTDTSSLDLHYIVTELQFLVGGKVDKIYQEQKNMILQLHVTSHGRQMLNVMAPNFFYISSKKPEFPQKPGGFCMFLRKYLDGTRVRSISQVGFERIIEIRFESKDESYKMIIELFSNGNILLCKEDYTIMSALETKNWGKRNVRGGVVYEFPRKEYDVFEMKEEDLEAALKKTDKESIVKMLAIELGFGGVYAEEICSDAKIDKSKKTLDKEEITRLFKSIKKITKHKITPIITEKREIFPFKLLDSKNEISNFENFNNAIDSVITSSVMLTKTKEAKTKHDKKMDKVKDIIKKQQRQVEELKKSYEENQRKGELIYENYALVKEVLDTIKKAREKHSWKEIKEKLKGHKLIKEIDEKESKIVIEIDEK